MFPVPVMTVFGDREVIDRFRKAPATARTQIEKVVRIWGLRVEARAKKKVSGEVLNVRTGRLRRSIHTVFTSNAREIKSRVSSSGDVKYAGIHEFGGQTAPHVIRARNAQALRFPIGGTFIFRTQVNHPGSRMPQRSFLRSSLNEYRPQIIRDLRAAANPGGGYQAGLSNPAQLVWAMSRVPT